MTRTVLLVNGGSDLLAGLQEGLRGRSEPICVLPARDGGEALQILQRRPVSLVVAELQPARRHGREVLAAVTAAYPDIPVVAIGAEGRRDLLTRARRRGAAGCIARPFPIERLTGQILALFRKEGEGGVLHEVSSATYLQLVEMDQKTCTVRLEDRASGRRGALFFVEGALCDARLGELKGTAAALEMFGWDPVRLWIQNGSAVRQNRIRTAVHRLALEAARRRDEGFAPPAAFSAPASEPPPAGGRRPDCLEVLRRKMETGLGPRDGLEGVFRDPFWTEGLRRLSCRARKLKLGRLLTGYVDRGEAHAYVVAGGERPAVIVVNRKCHRDKLMQMAAARERGATCRRIS